MRWNPLESKSRQLPAAKNYWIQPTRKLETPWRRWGKWKDMKFWNSLYISDKKKIKWTKRKLKEHQLPRIIEYKILVKKNCTKIKMPRIWKFEFGRQPVYGAVQNPKWIPQRKGGWGLMIQIPKFKWKPKVKKVKKYLISILRSICIESNFFIASQLQSRNWREKTWRPTESV